MSLNMMLSALKIAGRQTQSIQAWSASEELRAQNIARFRKYVEGDHDNTLTTEQKRLLNIKGGTAEDSARFNDNYCSILLDTELDRINLIGIKTDSDTGDTWATALLERNRIDALQVDVHSAALSDGDTYLMVYPDPVTGQARFSHEPAYDGAFGTVLMYETSASVTPLLAVKAWKITTAEIADTTRVNVYYPDRIERWVGMTADGLKPYSSEGEKAVEWWTKTGLEGGEPLGVPFAHFRNRSRTGDNFGLSELNNVIPLQNAANVVLTSVVASALLSGFPIRAAIGMEVPAAVVPGLVLNSFPPKDAQGNPQVTSQLAIDLLNAIRLEQFEVAELDPLLSVLAALKLEMFAVTNTPTDDVAADASGEARKQSEVKLIGKVKRFCVKNGNAWEDAVRLAARIEAVFTRSAPPINEDTVLTAQWRDPEIRNDALYADELRKDYEAGLIDQRTYLEGVQTMRGWDDAKVEAILSETEKTRNQQAQQEVDSANALMQAKADATAAMSSNGNGAKQPAP